jgi:hypothetical protein
MDVGLAGGIIGGALGLAGGAVGTYFGIRKTGGPRERTLMIRVSAVAWAAITAFLAGLLIVPKPYNLLLWLLYGIAFPLSIRWCNRRQLHVREEDSAAAKPDLDGA